MGKDRKGKELGVGISQRKDGLYTARFVNSKGNRLQKYFKKIQECRKWLADAQYEDEHSNLRNLNDLTMDAWFDYWFTQIKGNNLRYNSQRGYESSYRLYIKPMLGDMLIKDVKPIHCQNMLNAMEDYEQSTINYARKVLKQLFEAAVENDIIIKNPITKNVHCSSNKTTKERDALTVGQQKLFLQHASDSIYYNQFALLLQTGLRVGELSGLRWDDVDMENRILHIRRILVYQTNVSRWSTNEPKTKAGTRDIPLTQEALKIIQNQKTKMAKIKIMSLDFSGYMFLSENGNPIHSTNYNREAKNICQAAGIPNISTHILRHTFATRCIEGGMQPKTLQKILGHADISITMNRYVHVTDKQKQKEMEMIEAALNII